MTVYQSVSHPYEKVSYKKSFLTENEAVDFITEKWKNHADNQRADLSIVGFFQGRTVVLSRPSQDKDCKILETALEMMCPLFADSASAITLTLFGNERGEATHMAQVLRRQGIPIIQVFFQNKARL